ncbi:hypothetical protein ACN42_g10296 [Penicillium freii]|uniref:Uncharacterized protein n=1 Tax=Penicillium freii TaxID=48697 RepID=A0A117NKZ3_PENFR|nr:hypothetical protein ACN42_g10296 [Penicillium freii]
MSNSNLNSSSNHFSCPKGGAWYVCPDEPQFVGCCSQDPCTNVDANSTSPCPGSNLYSASYDPLIHEEIPANACIDGGKWFTCAGTNPPFIGCCASDPCKNPDHTGCPDDDLLPAAWSKSRPGQFALFQDEGTADDDGLSGGAIAGIVVGAVAALVIIGALVWFFVRRRGKKAAAMSGHGHTSSVVEGEHERMYPCPASPSFNSEFSSPAGTTIRGGKELKHMSNSSAGISPPSLSPGIPSENGRPISEIYSNSIGGEDMSHQKWVSGKSYGLGVHGAQRPDPIQELDADVAQVYEMDGLGPNRR